MLNYSCNFLEDFTEVQMMKDITEYICEYLTTPNAIKSTEKDTQIAMLYISSQFKKNEIHNTEVVTYLDQLINKTIKKYEETEDFIYCYNLFELKKEYLIHYGEYCIDLDEINKI